jgi:hypothetical protein
MTLALIVGGVGVGLAFLIADFAERVRHRVYAARDRPTPDSSFRRNIGVVLSVFFVAWSMVAYL